MVSVERDWGVLARTPVPVRYGLFYLTIALGMSWPIFLGYVPVPADIITNYPLWGSFQIPFEQRYYGVMEDLVRSFYPWHRLIGESVQGGMIPLWNPYVLNGFPMHAANATAMFAPLTALSYVLPFDAAWTAGFLLRPVFAALGTALYARALGLGHSAALSAGLVLAWCGFQVGWAGQAMTDIVVWLPWVMLGVLRVAERATGPRIALTAIALAVPHLSGHPEVAVYVTLMGVGSALLYLIWPPLAANAATRDVWRMRLRALLGLTAMAALALLLAAIQLLPTIEWIPQLKRELVGVSPSMPARDALNFVIRHMAAAPVNVVGSFIPNAAMYAGLVTLLVVPAALTHPRQREVWFFMLVLITALQFAFGWGPLVWLHHSMPTPIDFPKMRIILLADFSLAMLAGFGVSALSSAGRRVPRAVVGVIIVCAVGLGTLLLRLPDAGPLINDAADPLAGPRSLFQGTPFAIALVVAVALATGVPSMRSRGRPHGAALCLLVAVDLLTFAYGHVPFSRTDVMLSTPPAIQFLQEHSDASSRILSTRNVIPYNWEAQYRLATPNGYLYVTKLIADVMAPITIGPDPGVIELRHDRLLQSRSPLIDFLGVRYLVADHASGSADYLAGFPERFTPVFDDGYVRVYENPRALPRARLVPCDGIEVQQFQRRAISRVNSPAFDHATMVILNEKIQCPEVAPPDGASLATDQAVEVVEATFNTYEVRANVVVPSLLVYSDTFYVGWRGFVDGEEVPIVRANHAFKALRVDPGQHLVRFVFDPWSFRLGSALSVIGLVIVGVLLALGTLRARLSGRG